MNKHSKSLFVSLLIHSLLLGVVFYAYTTATAYVGKTKEKRVCIKLGTIQEVAAKKSEIVSKTATTTDKKVIEKKKVVKKPVKKVKKKVPKKKPLKKIKKKPIKKKNTPIKKKVPQKVIPPEPKQLEIVEEEKIPEVITGKEELCSKTAKEDKNKKEKACKNDSKATTTQQKPSAKEVYINQHLQEIARLLQENLYYPRRARKRGIEGKVLVKFTLQRNAEVVDVEVVSSSNSILSRGAMKTLENLSGQFPHPDETLVLTVPISYRLSH